MTIKRGVVAAAALTSVLVPSGTAAASTEVAPNGGTSVMSINPGSCGRGLNTATTAWATCTGYGEWRLVTECYLTGSTSVPWAYQNGGTKTRYSSCPSWSHVTKIVVEAR